MAALQAQNQAALHDLNNQHREVMQIKQVELESVRKELTDAAEALKELH